MHARYLHGFGSGPKTAKGIALGKRLAGLVTSYDIPDLEGGDFPGLTMHRLLDRAEACLRALPDDGEPCLLIGSSLGGYAAAELAAQGRAHRVAALLLIAPAFGFTTRWLQLLGNEAIAAWKRDGSRPFFHYAADRELPLGYAFYESCRDLPELPGEPGVPACIVHGRQDQTVDHRFSLRYAAERPCCELHLVPGDHRLTDLRHEDLIAWCARTVIAGPTPT